MKTLRQRVAELMVRVHKISPELAEYHVAGMPGDALRRRFLLYVRFGLAKFTSGDAPKTDWQDAVVIQTGPTVTHSVPVLDAANKPTTADRKSEADLSSADLRVQFPTPIQLKVGGEVEGQRPSQVGSGIAAAG